MSTGFDASRLGVRPLAHHSVGRKRVGLPAALIAGLLAGMPLGSLFGCAAKDADDAQGHVSPGDLKPGEGDAAWSGDGGPEPGDGSDWDADAGAAGAAGDAGAGGTSGSGGSSGGAGDSGSGGDSGTGGDSGAGGSSGSAGDSGTGGTAGSAGEAGAGGSSGAAGDAGTGGTGGGGGDGGTGGTGGAAGDAGTGGSSGSAGGSLLCLDGVTGLPEPTEDQLFAEEVEARQRFLAAALTVSGLVLDASGDPVSDATVSVGDCGATAVTDGDGVFSIDGLGRHNQPVQVTASGFRESLTYAHLCRPTAVEEVVLDPIVLTPEDEDVVRFLFGGDVAFARRFLDPEGTAAADEVPGDDENALILASDPGPGTEQAMGLVRPIFLSVDYPVFNFESPVTDDPATPHESKSYVFFTLPGSLQVMSWLGVQYVGLGNNHLYDYLEQGVVDTLYWLDDAGAYYSGVGVDATAAFAAHVQTLGSADYAFLAATSIDGSQNPPLYVATDIKGGAADLRDTVAFVAAIEDAVDAGQVPIVQTHTGTEYSYAPTDYAYGRMQLAAASGAGLVIGHHPHVAQGFSHESGVLMVHSLGNLCFDQERLETMLGLVAVIDMRGATVTRARALPIYLEDFCPRPAVGDLADHLLRRVAEASDIRGGLAFAHREQAWIVEQESDVLRTERQIELTITVPDDGWLGIDLRAHAQVGESLTFARLDATDAWARPGQDLLLHGGFEDCDVDTDMLEATRWDVDGSSRYVCVHEPYRGAAALCSYRSAANISDSVVYFRNRVRVLGLALGEEPNKDVTIFGYVRGDNAGDATISVGYHASEGTAAFGEEVVFDKAGATYDWEPFIFDLSMPADEEALALRVFITHSPPASGEGVLRVDDLAVANWKEAQDLQAGLSLPAPNPYDFLRIEAPAGDHQLQLTFESQSAALLQ